MQDYHVHLKNAPAVRARVYRSLRSAQFGLRIRQIGRFCRSVGASAVSELAHGARQALRGLRRGVLLVLLYFGRNLVPNRAPDLSARHREGKWRVPDGMTVREAAGPLLSSLSVALRREKSDRPRSRMSRLGALGFAAVIALIICVTRFFGVGIRISVDGRYLGTVADETVFSAAVDLAENQARRCLGNLYTLSLVPVYEVGVARSDELLSAEQMSELLFNELGEVQELYTLTVDGVIIGAVTDRALVDDYLARRLAALTVDDPDASVAFAEDVQFEKRSVSVKYYMEPSELIARLSGFKSQAQTIRLQRGDTLASVAIRNGMTLEQLLELNPDLDPENAAAGDKVLISDSVDMLNVTVRKLETFEEAIPFETVNVDDYNLFIGQTRVKQRGRDGRKVVTAYRTYLNGEEVRRETLEETVLSEPREQIVRVGTRSRRAVATGSFQWPCSGRLSSYFGYRSSYRDFHTGVDIANSSGTPIYASDGGVVVVVKYLNYSYGRYVRIKHDDTGYETLYAHCNTILVKEGDRVYKGQQIATMGMTGRAYGYHCHFEIIENGTKVNPLKFLS